jgi:hypothetical protein
MKPEIKIDISSDGWKTVEQANEDIAALRECIVRFRECGMEDIDFSSVELAKKIRDKLFPPKQY